MREIRTRAELDAAFEAHEVVLLKHGATCPISRAARQEVAAFCQSSPEVAVHCIEVTGRRELSDEVARRLGVAHASPQLFIVRDGRIAYQASHFEISARELMARFAR